MILLGNDSFKIHPCILLCFIIISLHCCGTHPHLIKEPLENNDHHDCVILLSFDGFRWDYLYRLKQLLGDQSNFWKLINDHKHGSVYNKFGMNSSFATLTFPNHHTLVTGLHEENHGIVSNEIFVDEYNKSFYLGRNSNDYNLSFLFGGEPIYETVRKQLGMYLIVLNVLYEYT